MPEPNAANIERFMGFAATYDCYRPRPPEVLLALLRQIAGAVRPALVVDLGAGTGLSTLVWAPHAEQVVGVEPGADMRRQAERAAGGVANVRFVDGHAAATGVPDERATIVTVSQALHWMEPQPTFAEAARILVPGGVFAAYDYDTPPTIHWQIERQYRAVMQRAEQLAAERGTARGVVHQDKAGHLARMSASGCFRWTREVLVHEVVEGDVAHLMGGMRTFGAIAGLLQAGASEAELGLVELRQVAERILGGGTAPWYWSYRVRVGVK